MKQLNSYQKKYLKGLAHRLKPVVLIGQKGMTPPLVTAVDAALDRHELIKVKFNDIKDKKAKETLADRIGADTASALIGLIGHTAIFYRQHPLPEKRRIFIPVKRPARP